VYTGRPDLKLWVVSSPKKVCAYLWSVHSNPGPAAERERVFGRFYRVAENRSRGSGIGLSLVARIASSHGARIEVGEGLNGRGFGVSVFFKDAADH
jgi:two-component system, OmpR family, sensor histidine kinase QseC